MQAVLEEVLNIFSEYAFISLLPYFFIIDLIPLLDITNSERSYVQSL